MADQAQQQQVCPVCRTDAFLNPRIKFMLSPCYHWLCDKCVGRLYAHGSARCPSCSQTLRASSYSVPIFQDAHVEKECRVRRQVLLSLGHKSRDDFVSGEAYEDYLEQVEDMVLKLVKDKDADNIQKQLNEIRRMNHGDKGVGKANVVDAIADTSTSLLKRANRIEDELEAERKRRRIERDRDLQTIATGQSLLLKGLKSSRNVDHVLPAQRVLIDPLEGLSLQPSVLPFTHSTTTFSVGEQSEAGGMTSSLHLSILFGITNRCLLSMMTST